MKNFLTRYLCVRCVGDAADAKKAGTDGGTYASTLASRRADLESGRRWEKSLNITHFIRLLGTGTGLGSGSG